MPSTPPLTHSDRGRLGGAAGTRKQQRARKRNAQSAGRPGRVCATCGEPVVGGHVDRALDVSCGAHGWRWHQRSRDEVQARPAAPLTLQQIDREIDSHQQAIADLQRARDRAVRSAQP